VLVAVVFSVMLCSPPESLGLLIHLLILFTVTLLFSRMSTRYCKCGSLPLVFVRGVRGVKMCDLTVVGDETRCGVDVGGALQISVWVVRSVFH
jgi:hypothetical protein